MSNADVRDLRHPGMHNFVGRDIAHVIVDRAETLGDETFLVWEPFSGESKTWSWTTFVDEVLKLATGLDERGVGVGDKVLIHLENCPEAVLAWYACAVRGAVAVTTNARSVADEMSYFAQAADIRGAITQPKFAHLVADNCDPAWLLVTDSDSGEAPEVTELPERAEPFASLFAEERFALRPADSSLRAGVQFTSGTTSRPKGVVWTHANVLWGGKQSSANLQVRQGDVFLTHLPFFHTNAQAYCVAACVWVGATVVLQPRFSASRFWDVSVRNGCTHSSMVPFCSKALMSRKEPVPEHQYRVWGNGLADWPSPDVFGIKTLGWWGMTETVAPGIISDPLDPITQLAIGRPATGYELAILDDAGNPVPPGETGELHVGGVRGVSIFLEYLDDPGATEATFDEQGFIKTGDRVTLLEDGSIKFADRDKDMLKVGGENVAASEIERVILSVRGINEVAVVAKRDRMLDEVPVAFITAKPKAAGDPDALVAAIEAACQDQLADFKQPREIRVLEELPKSTLDKIAKAELRTLLEND